MKLCNSCGHDNPEEARFCGKCGTSLAEDEVSEPPASPPSLDRSESEQSTKWYYEIGSGNEGPVELAEIKKMLASGVLSPTNKVWCKDLPGWTPSGAVVALQDESAEAVHTVDGPESATTVSGELLKLTKLLDAGALTRGEFEAEKAKLLAPARPPTPVAPARPPVPVVAAPDNVFAPPSVAGTSATATPSNPPMPPNYMVQAILATFFCCMPVGVFAIIKAVNVANVYNTQGYEAALAASAGAKTMVTISVVVGLLWIPLYTFLVIVGEMAGN